MIFVGIFAAFHIVNPLTIVYAGQINSDEASIVSAASGTFTYNGETYRAQPAYIQALKDYLADDDVDLNADQASSAISQMYDSIQQGVEDGYLYKTSGLGTQPTTEPVTSGIVLDGGNPSSDSGNTDKLKEKNTAPKDKAGKTDSKDGDSDAQNSGDSTEPGQNDPDNQIYLDKNGEENYSGAVQKLFLDSKQRSKEETKNSFFKIVILLAVLCVIALCVWLIKVLLHKHRAVPYLAALKEEGITELHCHILPGVDDGSKNMETSMKMVEIGYRDGVRRMIVTPHYIPNHLQYNEEKLQKVFSMFTAEVQKVHPDMECYLGNELYFQGQVLDDVKAGKVHTMAGSKYLLVEFSTKITYHDMYREMKNIVQARYYPILAHMERFQCLTHHPERVSELAELGVYFQMNADSVLGKGADKKWCRRMLKENRIQFLGTDAHGITHRTPEMAKAVKWIYEHIDPWDAEDLLINNPKKILKKERID